MPLNNSLGFNDKFNPLKRKEKKEKEKKKVQLSH